MELVPPELHDFKHMFSEEAAQCFPEPKHWDHTIDLLKNVPAMLDCKVYPLTQDEQVALDKFLKEYLDKELHSSFQFSVCSSILLCQKEGWQVAACSELSTS